MSPLWTSADAAAATGGRATRAWEASGLSIDSRTLRPGDLFVALTDRRDGHDFVAAALAAGAAAALVSRMPEGAAADAPLILVDDVLGALEALAAAARARTQARVIAVTGSVGKTSTKEMLRAMLGGEGPVHAAEASLNNHWGVPLTLARMPADAAFAVIEIGMSARGEIAPLARLARPHVALVTTVAPAHLAAFADGIAGIAAEKASIMEGLEPGGTAVLPAGLETSDVLARHAERLGVRMVWFGPDGDYRLGAVVLAEGATVAHVETRDRRFLLRLATPARHFASNALGALAAAEAAGADSGLAILGLGQWRASGGRGLTRRVVLDVVDDHLGFDLIDDAYNANPASVGAALDMLATAAPQDGVGRIEPGRRIAILGDMLELGTEAEALHRALAEHRAMAAVDVVHCIGPLMASLWDALPDARRGERTDDATALAAHAARLVDAGDVVLVKGSKASGTARVVDALLALGHPAAPTGEG